MLTTLRNERLKTAKTGSDYSSSSLSICSFNEIKLLNRLPHPEKKLLSLVPMNSHIEEKIIEITTYTVIIIPTSGSLCKRNIRKRGWTMNTPAIAKDIGPRINEDTISTVKVLFVLLRWKMSSSSTAMIFSRLSSPFAGGLSSVPI